MNDRPWDRLERLCAAARREEPAPLDVTRAVLLRIASSPRRPAPVDRTLAWCTLGSVAAAGLMAIAASGAFDQLVDPLAALVQSCDVVLR